MPLPSQAFHKERQQPKTQAERDEIAKVLHPRSVPGSAVHDLSDVDYMDVLVFDIRNNGQFCSAYTVAKRTKTTITLSCGMLVDVRTGKVQGHEHAVARLPKTGEVESEERKAAIGRLQYYDYERMSINQLRVLNAKLDQFAEQHREFVAARAAGNVVKKTSDVLPDTRSAREEEQRRRDESQGRVRKIGDDEDRARSPRAEEDDDDYLPRKVRRSEPEPAPARPKPVTPRPRAEDPDDDERPRKTVKRRYTYEDD